MLIEMAKKVGAIQEHVMPWQLGQCFEEEKCATERSWKVKKD